MMIVNHRILQIPSNSLSPYSLPFSLSLAVSIESIPANKDHSSEMTTVIAIDGTWAQARSLLSGNEFLQKLKKVD